MTSDDDRIAYLAGDRSGSWTTTTKTSTTSRPCWPILRSGGTGPRARGHGSRERAPSPPRPFSRCALRPPRSAIVDPSGGARRTAAAAVVVVARGHRQPRRHRHPTVRRRARPHRPRPCGARLGDRQFDSGWRIELDASGLRLDDGSFYQAWLRNDDDVPRADRVTFNEGEDVTLWARVSPEELPDDHRHAGSADGDRDRQASVSSPAPSSRIEPSGLREPRIGRHPYSAVTSTCSRRPTVHSKPASPERLRWTRTGVVVALSAATAAITLLGAGPLQASVGRGRQRPGRRPHRR